jgi:hypothetical protein
MKNRSAAPQLSDNPLLGSWQLLIWFFFRPSAWRACLQQIDPALTPHFCLAELTDVHWQHPLLRRLLAYGYVALPILSVMLITSVLVISEQLTQLAMIGLLFGLGTGLLLGTTVSAAGGIVAAVVGSSAFAITWSGANLLFDIVTTPMMGIIYGLITAAVVYVLLNIADQRHPPALIRQTGSFVLGFIASLAVIAIIIGVTAVTIPIGEQGGLGNRVLGLIVAVFTGSLVGLSIGWRTLKLMRGWTLALVSTIILFNIFGDVGNEYGRIPSGLLLIRSSSLVFTLFFVLLFGLVYVSVERFAGARPAAIASSLGSIAVHFPLGNLMGLYNTQLNLAVSLSLSLLGLTASIWRPILIFPLEAALTTLLLRIDQGRKSIRPGLLHLNPGFWDESQFLKLYGLDEHLVFQAERNPEQGQIDIEYVSRGRQRWAAQAAQIELDARRFETCDSAEAIAELTDILMASALIRPASDIVSSFATLSQDTAAALAQVGLYNQRLGLGAVSQALNSLQRELIRSTEPQAERFQPIAAQWQHILDERVHELTTLTEIQQEIQNPYIVGAALTRRQELFVGRADISIRIEELMRAQDYPPLLLYGQRRMGKTSLLYQLRWLLPNHILPLVVDLQGPVTQTTDHPGFLYAIAKKMSRSASSQGIMLPELPRDALTGDPFLIFDDWLDSVEEQMIQQSYTTLLLALDEFEELDGALVSGKFDDRAILGTLRHIVQHRSRFKLLLAGSHTLEEFQRWSSYLINAQTIHLSYLVESEARRLIERPITDFALSYTPKASQRVLTLTRGHPYLIQLLCSEIVTFKNQQKLELRRLATVSDVEVCVLETLTRGSQFFDDIERNQVDDPARELLHAIARTRTGKASFPQLELELRSLMDVGSTLQLLIRREILELVDGEYRFQVELVRRWFERHYQGKASD